MGDGVGSLHSFYKDAEARDLARRHVSLSLSRNSVLTDRVIEPHLETAKEREYFLIETQMLRSRTHKDLERCKDGSGRRVYVGFQDSCYDYPGFITYVYSDVPFDCLLGSGRNFLMESKTMDDGQALVKSEASPKGLLSNILTKVHERRTGLRVSRSKMTYTASSALNVDCSSEAIQNGSSIG